MLNNTYLWLIHGEAKEKNVQFEPSTRHEQKTWMGKSFPMNYYGKERGV